MTGADVLRNSGEREPAEIAVTFAYDRKLWRRAMSGWWRSVVPPAPFMQRAIFWAVIWVTIGVFAGVIAVFGLTPYYVLAGLLGAAVLVAVFVYLQRTRMAQFWNVVGRHWDRAGETHAVFGPGGVTLSDAVSRRDLAWSAVDAVAPVRGATVLRSGISMIAIPDAALPAGLDAQAFRARLAAWRQA